MSNVEGNTKYQIPNNKEQGTRNFEHRMLNESNYDLAESLQDPRLLQTLKLEIGNSKLEI
jgi:hypothetical protein